MYEAPIEIELKDVDASTSLTHEEGNTTQKQENTTQTQRYKQQITIFLEQRIQKYKNLKTKYKILYITMTVQCIFLLSQVLYFTRYISTNDASQNWTYGVWSGISLPFMIGLITIVSYYDYSYLIKFANAFMLFYNVAYLSVQIYMQTAPKLEHTRMN